MRTVTDNEFRRYGRVLTGYDTEALQKEMKHTPLPADTTTYVASSEELEGLAVARDIMDRAYGGMPIQIGYCNGHNDKLNAVEYHRDSEINLAVNDMILLLGSEQDIADDFTYDTDRIEAFLVPAGTMIEVYATTLHYAPCGVGGDGFRCVVVLPRGTNTEIDFPIEKSGEMKLMTARNKWLIAHPDAQIEGAFNGLKGENITVTEEL